MKLKKFLAASLAAVMVLGLAACGGGSESKDAGKTAGGEKKTEGKAKALTVLSFNASDPYTAKVMNQLKEQGKAAGFDVQVQDAQNDLAKQNDQLDIALGDADVIAIQPVQNNSTKELIEKAKDKKPTVFFNREYPEGSEIMKENGSIFVGTKIEDAGIMQGQLFLDLYKEHPELDKNKDGEISYILLMGEPVNPEAKARSEYSVKTIKDAGIKLKQVGETLVANWDLKQAKDACDAVLANNKDVELILANNDNMALGAVNALQEIGFNKEVASPKDIDYAKWVPVIGVDALDTAKEAIAKGTMAATVMQDDVKMAQAIVQISMNQANGKRGADSVEGTDFKTEDGVSVRIPYVKYTAETK